MLLKKTYIKTLLLARERCVVYCQYATFWNTMNLSCTGTNICTTTHGQIMHGNMYKIRGNRDLERLAYNYGIGGKIQAKDLCEAIDNFEKYGELFETLSFVS